jgi:uncharacterized protein (TIGR00296 family)
MAIQATEEMCFYCFDVLINHLEGRSCPQPPAGIDDTAALIFVTWRRGDPETGILRGCKGCTAGPKPLPEQLRRYAILSGTQDTRFDPITRQEVSELSCHVSILHSFETVEHYSDWIVGVHGVTIDFEVYDHPVNDKHTSSSNLGKPTFEGHAIFLPGVAPSNNWDQETTIVQLIRKAGYKGKVDMSKIRIVTTRFQTASAHTHYNDYIKARSNNHTGPASPKNKQKK